jgi:hypothetical protein
MTTSTQKLVLIDRDTYEETFPGHGLELTTSYCSNCGTTNKEVGAFRCNGNKKHELCSLIK